MAYWRTTITIISVMLFNLLMDVSTKERDWADDCPIPCRCKWSSGRKTVDCSKSQLATLPSKLSSEVQSVDLSSNQIYSLAEDAFTRIGLANLQKIFLKECQIRDVHKDAFRGLKILIELDLSFNQIHVLNPGTFRDNEKLRMLYLSNNPIEKLDDGLFSNHTFLQTVLLSECSISKIGPRTFTHVPVLSTLKLDGNQLRHLNVATFESLKKLRSLEIGNNPWNCDCKLRDFRDWIIERNLYTLPTICKEPPYLTDQLWNNIDSEKFACKPEIIWPESKIKIRITSGSVTLGCRISGDPKPTLHWVFNSRIIENNTQGLYSTENRYMLQESLDGHWFNLTINKIRAQDEGDYSCVATSPGGIDERNITLQVRTGSLAFIGGDDDVSADIWLLLIFLLIGVVCAFILLFVLCCICCRKNNDSKKPFNSSLANGSISHHTLIEPDQRKTLLTSVNPVQKPPRKYDNSPRSEHNGLAERTELNRNLLDDSSVNGAPSGTVESAEDQRSTDSTEQLSIYRNDNTQYTYVSADKMNLDSASHSPQNPYHHPPDLLSFPNRGIPASPAGSYASNELSCYAPSMQAHAHNNNSNTSSSYGTLPYNRSQSPFSPTCSSSSGPVISQRQGYVTIPRRPRIPSWASAPTPTLLEDPVLLKMEPVYDNLGPRTTADGSSILSLPRSLTNEAPSNVRNRPLPQAPAPTAASVMYSQTLPHKNKLNAYNNPYFPIQENDSMKTTTTNSKSSVESSGVIKPLPLPLESKTMPKVVVDKRRSSWSNNKNAPETGILKRPIPVSGTAGTDRDRLITSSPIVSIVKPKVPPKPLQKVIKENGPLFEDEGEDGTEV